jgi:GAF domain-containing protein
MGDPKELAVLSEHDADQSLAAVPQEADPGATRDLAEMMSAIARRLRIEQQPVETTLEAISASAVEAVPGAEDAGITFVTKDGRVQARAATGDRPAILDKLQDHLGQGPCLRALSKREIVEIADMAADRRWPRFSAAAAEHGVGSMLALRLYVTAEKKLGALNLYAGEPHAFDEESAAVARIYAVHAAIALAAAERETRLEAALRSRDRISQAKGILMERYKLTPDQAFTLLARASSLTNRKIRDIAEEIATTGELPA